MWSEYIYKAPSPYTLSLYSPHRIAVFGEVLFKVRYAQFAKVEQARGQCRLRARVERLFEMFFAARAARRDYRHADFVRDSAGYLDVEAGLFAVGVHAGKQYFARAQPDRAHRPFLRVHAGVDAPAVYVYLPMIAVLGSARVDCAYHARRGN